ncbi:MAG: thermonuclease family protein [Nitrospinota bacterium]
MALVLFAVVLRVVDGDTLIVAGKVDPFSWQAERVRLASCDAPELRELDGKRAKEFMERLFPRGTEVILIRSDGRNRGPFGRLLRDILRTDGLDACEELVKAGFGKWRKRRHR